MELTSEHLLCLNRAGARSGPEWFVNEVTRLAAEIRHQRASEDASAVAPWDKPARLTISVWWGGEDSMVPSNGQQWLNKTLSKYPKEIELIVHNVEDGDHGDL